MGSKQSWATDPQDWPNKPRWNEGVSTVTRRTVSIFRLNPTNFRLRLMNFRQSFRLRPMKLNANVLTSRLSLTNSRPRPMSFKPSPTNSNANVLTSRPSLTNSRLRPTSSKVNPTNSNANVLSFRLSLIFLASGNSKPGNTNLRLRPMNFRLSPTNSHANMMLIPPTQCLFMVLLKVHKSNSNRWVRL